MLELAQHALEAMEEAMKKEVAAELSAAEIRGELADTFGMKGGVNRRLGNLHQAYLEYFEGQKIESKDQLSTYNLGNVIALGITEERIPPDDLKMRSSIELAIKQLVAKTSGSRTDEWWAWSDLGQLYLLTNDVTRALAAYERARKTGPTTEEYGRHLEVLRQLHEATSSTAPDVAAGVAQVLVDLSTEGSTFQAADISDRTHSR